MAEFLLACQYRVVVVVSIAKRTADFSIEKLLPFQVSACRDRDVICDLSERNDGKFVSYSLDVGFVKSQMMFASFDVVIPKASVTAGFSAVSENAAAFVGHTSAAHSITASNTLSDQVSELKKFDR